MHTEENGKGEVQGRHDQVAQFAAVEGDEEGQAEHGQVDGRVLLVGLVGDEDGAKPDTELEIVKEIGDCVPLDTAQTEKQRHDDQSSENITAPLSRQRVQKFLIVALDTFLALVHLFAECLVLVPGTLVRNYLKCANHAHTQKADKSP